MLQLAQYLLFPAELDISFIAVIAILVQSQLPSTDILQQDSVLELVHVLLL
jgi:hypothetical protein